MSESERLSFGKPYDIHTPLLFACEIVRAAQFLQQRGPVGRALSYQILAAGTSAGANAAEADSGTSRDDFIAKTRIAPREAKETRFRLQVCRRTGHLEADFDPLIDESDRLVRILATIVRNAVRKRATERTGRSRSQP